MRDALSDLAGGPLPDWPLAKASLPSSLGGLKCSSSLLAYLCHLYCFLSSMQTPNIKDPGYTAKPPVHLPDAIKSVELLTRHLLMPFWIQLPTFTPKLWPFHPLFVMQV